MDDNAQPANNESDTHDADEAHTASSASRLNWLRAGVLGANDGIVSVAGIVVGVAGATPSRGPIFTAGLAGLVAGAVSMALGEYISVSSQRDSERAQLVQEKRELSDTPDAELEELIGLYEAKGLTHATASTVARELTEHDALRAHLDTELHLDPDDLANPVQACRGVRPVIHARSDPAAARDPVTSAGLAYSDDVHRGACRIGHCGNHQRPNRWQQPPPCRHAGGHRRRNRARVHLRNWALVRRRHRLIARRHRANANLAEKVSRSSPRILNEWPRRSLFPP